jgi:predicted negative regulator of RcsB-dependent stress response
MFGSIQAWAAGKVFELAATGVVVVGLIGWYAWNNHQQRQIGAERVLAQSRKVGDAANAKSEEYRTLADKPGAAERMRKRACRDCQ